MGFSIGGSIGPLRASVRLGGGRGTTQNDPAFTALLIGVALLSAGGWGAEQGLRGNWGVTGRVFGWLFIIATVVSLVNRYAATFFLTSWLYRLLAVVGYFDWGLSFVPDADSPGGWETADEFFSELFQALFGFAVIGLTIAVPPLVVFVFNSLVAGRINAFIDKAAAGTSGAGVQEASASPDVSSDAVGDEDEVDVAETAPSSPREQDPPPPPNTEPTPTRALSTSPPPPSTAIHPEPARASWYDKWVQNRRQGPPKPVHNNAALFILGATDFRGTSSRREFWQALAVLAGGTMLVFSTSEQLADSLSIDVYDIRVSWSLLVFASILPLIACWTRRLRAAGFSPYWMLLLPVSFLLLPGAALLILAARPSVQPPTERFALRLATPDLPDRTGKALNIEGES